MKLLINDKELIAYIASLIDVTAIVNDIELEQHNVNKTISWVISLKENINKLIKHKPKIKGKIEAAVREDLHEYCQKIKSAIKTKRNKDYEVVKKKLNYILQQIGEEKILNAYKNSNAKNYVKSIGTAINPEATAVRRYSFNNVDEDCVLRNTVGNEELLVNKIDNNKPFWFIDSGYTNFLGKNKIWHRLVRNHLHFGRNFIAPVDRLGIFETFPQQWRNSGDRILVIEPGPFAAAIFHVDIKQWKYKVEQELRQYTDKKIIFREKAPKKQRESLYNHLCNEDYYSVININSNAATEALWAGIPVITLDRHISNPVSKNKLSDINNLYRGSLAEWLCMLSYSQFTFEELENGTALNIIKKYHE